LKKIILSILVLITFLLNSCGEQKITCHELFESVMVGIDYDNLSLFQYRSDLADSHFFLRLYFETKEEGTPHAFSLCNDYMVALSSSSEIWEIHIFRATSLYDTDTVREMLSLRRDRLQQSQNSYFYSDNTEKRISEAVIVTKNHFVCLLITDNNKRIEELIEQCLS